MADEGGGAIDPREGADPRQASLDALLASVVRVRVHRSGVAEGRLLTENCVFESTDAEVLRTLSEVLRVDEDPSTFGRCLCMGHPALELVSADGSVEVVGIHHGHGIRWPAWRYDARLRDGAALADWLAGHGVEDLRVEMRQARLQAEQGSRALERWKAAMPACLRANWEEVEPRTLAEGEDPPLESFVESLGEAMTDEAARIRALFEWFGSGAGPWSGHPSYETLPESMLLLEPTERLLAALEPAALESSGSLREGAARFFAGWAFRKQRRRDRGRIGPELARRLLRHVEAQPGDDGRRRRAREAFAER